MIVVTTVQNYTFGGVSPKMVLVVDDDTDIVAFLRDALTDEGYQVTSAGDGASVPVACRVRPDLVLLDVQMPGMDGIEVSRRLKANPHTRHIPIIGMSAGATLGDPRQAMHAVAVLAKPFDLGGLRALVAQYS